jgi:polyisoprenoid-binding protein YceI
MKNLLVALACLVTVGVSAQNWKVDASHSNVKFKVSYLLISEVEGNFKKFDGSFTSEKADFSDLSVSMSVDVASINTGNDMRDGHVKGDDFFNAEKFPTMTFKSTSVKALGKGKLMLTGDLTIRDVTKRVTIPVVYGGTVKDPYGNTRAGFKATGTINRKEFKLLWDNKAATGEAVVGDDVEFTIDASLIKQ